MLAGNMRVHHGREVEGRRSWTDTPIGKEPQTYQMALPTTGGPRNFPVEGCLGRAATRTAMQVHFILQHLQDTVVILEKGKHPNPRCPRCKILVL